MPTYEIEERAVTREWSEYSALSFHERKQYRIRNGGAPAKWKRL